MGLDTVSYPRLKHFGEGAANRSPACLLSQALEKEVTDSKHPSVAKTIQITKQTGF